jgi:hypothetical protein
MSGEIARLGSGISGSVFSIPEDPQHDVAGGEPSQLLSPVAIASLGDSRLVTAHRASPDILQVTAWALDETGSLSRTSQLAGDPATAISLCAVTLNRVVSVVRNGLGNLELVVWDVDRGQLIRRGTGHAGEVTAVAVCAVSASRVVAVMRNGSGNLELISWDIDGNGNLQRRGTGEAGGVWAVGVTAVTESRVVAVMKNLSLNLELIVWDVTGDGAFIRRGEGDAGTVGAVSIASLGTGKVIAVMRNGSHDLELIVWDIDEDGHMKRRGYGLAGVGDVFTQEKSNIGVTANPQYGTVVSAARNKIGDLELTSWYVNNEGIVSRQSTVSAEAISAVAISGLDEHHFRHFATAVCDGQGQLECIAWTVA